MLLRLANAVHGGLDKVLGQSGAEAVLSHMKMTNNLPDPAEFHKKLLALFGAQGTLSLERAIVKDLAIRLKWSLALLKMEDSFDFSATMRARREGSEGMTTRKGQRRRLAVQLEPKRWTAGSGAEDLIETRIASVLGLKQFMQGPIRTLLIKGLAGTGKTTVALEILKAAGKGNGAYISSRVPKELLETHIPAMKETLQNQEFLDIRLEDATSVLDFRDAADGAQEGQDHRL